MCEKYLCGVSYPRQMGLGGRGMFVERKMAMKIQTEAKGPQMLPVQVWI